MSEFLHMGGYAIYVWGSFGAGAAVFAWNWLAARGALRRATARLRGGRPT